MPISSHSHSGQFCKHAYGTLQDVVDRAVDMGFKCYSLTEHMPRSRICDLYPEESDLTCSDLNKMFDDFYHLARRIQVESPIKIFVGMEIEWIHSGTWNELLGMMEKYQLDYLVGSVHHVNGIPIDFDQKTFYKLEQSIGLEATFSMYFDAQFDMLTKVKPRVIGHFDLVRMWRCNFEPSLTLWEKINRNIDFIVSYGGLVEINSRAYKKGLPGCYPLPDILEIMIKKNVKFTISDDCHGPNDVGMHYDKLYKYLVEHDIKVFYSADMKEYTLQDSFWTRFQ